MSTPEDQQRERTKLAIAKWGADKDPQPARARRIAKNLHDCIAKNVVARELGKLEREEPEVHRLVVAIMAKLSEKD